MHTRAPGRPRGQAFAVLGLGALAAACGAADGILLVPEEATGFETWIAWGGGALAASSGGAIELRFDPSADGSAVVLAAYAASPAELGLEPGPLPERQRCRSCELLRPSAAWRRELDEGSGVGWVPELPLPEPVQDALVPDRERCARCRPFGAAASLADERPSLVYVTAFVTGWGDGVIIGYTDGTLRKVAPGRPAEPACVPSEAFRPQAGYRATAEVFWVVDVVNRVFRLDLDRLEPTRGCEEAATLASSVPWAGDPVWSLSGPPTANPDRLWGLTAVYGATTSTLSRYAFDAGTEVLGSFDEAENELGVAWAAPDRVLAVNGGRSILRVEGESLRKETVRVQDSERMISAVVHHPTRGFLLGSSNNLVLVENREGTFDLLRDSVLGQRVERIIDYRGGLVVGERNGVFRQFYDDVGYCPAERGFGGEGLNALVATPDGALLGGSNRFFFHEPAADECAPQPSGPRKS